MDKDKLLKILIIIIAIIFFLLGVYSIYKFIIINKIYNKMAEYVALENFSMKVIDSENSSGSIEMYYKFLKSSSREKDKKRIPLVEAYIKNNK